LQLIADQELLFEPGTRFQYSNFGYSLLALVLEKVSGKSYPQLLRERIYEPAGLRNTSTMHGAELISKRASRYRYWFLNDPELAPQYDRMPGIGCGDIYSTVEDLYKFDRALYTDSLLSGESRELSFTPGLDKNGFGWIIEDHPLGPDGQTVRVIRREGGAEGTRTCMLRLVDDGHLIVLLSNHREPYFMRTWLARPMQDIAPQIIAILYEQEYELPKKSAVREMVLSMRAHGWEQTERTFRDEIQSDGQRYEFTPEEYHWAAYGLYQDRQSEEALRLYRFAETYLPMGEYEALWNFFFDYGRALMARGEWAQAIPKLEEALRLNPADQLNVSAYIDYCRQQLASAAEG
jgi:hypothetical protein